MTGGTSRTDAHGGAIIHNYADVGELIQWSDEAFDVVPSNEAYKLWVN